MEEEGSGVYCWALLASDLRGRASLADLMPGTHGIDLTGSVFYQSFFTTYLLNLKDRLSDLT